jgi:spermidine synthase
MARGFEELDFQATAMGDLILRRRIVPALGNREVYEVILGDAFLMSSLFTVVEEALADLGLATIDSQCRDLRVVVGGLGLGHTAAAALRDQRVGELLVIDTMAEVIGWHERGLVPLGGELCADSRCRFVHEDFFARAADPGIGFDPLEAGRRFDAVLLDIDHTPGKHLDASHAGLYTPRGLHTLAQHLRPGGVFAMWSDDPPEEEFLGLLRSVFTGVRAEVVTFANPLQERDCASTVYLAVRRT